MLKNQVGASSRSCCAFSYLMVVQLLYYLKGPPALGKKPQLKGFIPLDHLRVSCDEADFPSKTDYYDGKALVLLNRRPGFKVKSCKLEDGHGLVQADHNLFLLVAASREERDSWVVAIQNQIDARNLHTSLKKPSSHSELDVTALPAEGIDKLRSKVREFASSVMVIVENHTSSSFGIRQNVLNQGQWCVVPPQHISSHCEQAFAATSKTDGSSEAVLCTVTYTVDGGGDTSSGQVELKCEWDPSTDDSAGMPGFTTHALAPFGSSSTVVVEES